jgi:hypothetical protein
MAQNMGGHITSHGYKIIYVGKDHHLADVRGYAYEHRIVAEKKLGRKLKPKEQVHHNDENKLNNSEENLIVTKSIRHHRLLHRKKVTDLKMPDEQNRVITCSCGCGRSFLKYDSSNRPRKYLPGHNPQTNNFVKQQLIKIIDNIGTAGISLKQLAAITKFNVNSIKTRLGILCSQGKISRIGHGIYAKAGSLALINIDEVVKCKCGCGEMINKYDSSKRVRQYISGHNMRNKQNGNKY